MKIHGMNDRKCFVFEDKKFVMMGFQIRKCDDCEEETLCLIVCNMPVSICLRCLGGAYQAMLTAHPNEKFFPFMPPKIEGPNAE